MEEIKVFNYIEGQRCEDDIIYDSKLKESFELLTENNTEIIMDYLKKKCSFEEMKIRQELFQLVLSNEKNFEEIMSLRKVLISLSKIRENAIKEKEEIGKAVWWITFISRFGELIYLTEGLSEYLFSRSKSLKKLQLSISTYKNIMDSAQSDIEVFYKKTDECFCNNYIVNVKGGEVFGSTPIKYANKKDINVDLYESMVSLVPDIDFENKGYIGTARHKYLTKVIKDNNRLADELRDIIKKYNDILNFNEKRLLNDLFIIDGIVSFCKYYQNKGIFFSFPAIGKSINIKQARDISLIHQECNIVANDICIKEEKNTILITGANSGGKTSFLRALQQIYVLGLAGLPVPAETAEIIEAESLYSFFETDEAHNGLGRYANENMKIQKKFSEARNSIIFVNEMFSSTYEERSTENIVALINNNENNTVFVNTHFLDVAANTNEQKTEYLMTELSDDKPTHRIVKGVYGASITHAILKKYKMTKEDLNGR